MKKVQSAKKRLNFLVFICTIITMFTSMDIGGLQWDGFTLNASAKEYWEDWTELSASNTMLTGNYKVTDSRSLSDLTVVGTATIYIKPGYTLTVTGTAGSGRTGGKAAIQLTGSNILYVRGGGTLKAIGGDAAAGSTGGAGISGNTDSIGAGGDGGAGGGGGGAGIGTNGGMGGTGGSGAAGWTPGELGIAQSAITSADNGRAGTQADNMGTIYRLDNTIIDATGGSGSTVNGGGGPGGSTYTYVNGDWMRGHSGGGGGGGGGGGYPGNAIGTGGGGGGGGGGGSTGAYKVDERDMYIPAGVGGNGGGGYSGGGTRGSNGSHRTGNYSTGIETGSSASGTTNTGGTTQTQASRNSYTSGYPGTGGNGNTIRTAGSALIPGSSATITYDKNIAEDYPGTSTAVTGMPVSQPVYSAGTNYLAYGLTRTGYTFRGWATSATGAVTYSPDSNGFIYYGGTITNRTLYAVWQANGNTVTLNREGTPAGSTAYSGGTASVTATYDANMPTITRPTRVGYSFMGYWDNNTGSNGTQYYNAAGTSARTWNKTANTTLYVRWSANQYAVTLNQQGGSGGTDAVTATFDKTLPVSGIVMPVRSGYEFDGYWTQTNGSGTRYYNNNGTANGNWVVAADSTLYAKWVALPDVSVGKTRVNERAQNDGGITDTVIISLKNGVFTAGAENNLLYDNIPEGMTVSATRIDNTMLLVTFGGRARSHTAGDSADISIAVKPGYVTYATYNSPTKPAGELDAGTVSVIFRDTTAAQPPDAPVFYGSDGMPDGPAWADSITLTSARLHTIVNESGSAITERGFVYGPASGGEPTVSYGTKITAGRGGGNVSAGISGLTAGVEYVFRAYAVTAGGTFYSLSGSFTPSALCGMGSVTILPVRDDTATVLGKVLTDGGSQISAMGAVYSTSPEPSVNLDGSGLNGASVLNPANITGTFSVDLTGLDPNSQYYVRTFAINDSGIAYSAPVTMNTLASGLDANTYLESLVVDGGSMIPAFDKDVHTYMVSVPSARNNIQVTPTLQTTNGVTINVTARDQSWLKVNGTTNKSGKKATVVGINASSTNIIYIECTYQGKTRTYILNMISQPSGNADLSGMTLKEESDVGTEIPYTPDFNKDTANYTAVVDADVDRVHFDLDMGINTYVTAKINGSNAAVIEGDARAQGVVTLTGPSTSVKVQTTSEDGKTTRTYHVLIIKQVSSSAYLSDLLAGSASGSGDYGLMPQFEATQLDYSVAVPGEAAGLFLTPAAAPGAKISVTGTAADGSPMIVAEPDENASFYAEGLAAGINTLNINVTAPDGASSSAYTVVVTKPLSDKAELTNLVVRANTGGGAVQTLLPDFDPDITVYTVVVDNTVANAHITPTAVSGATYYFSGNPEYSAATAFSRATPLTLPLHPGINEIYVHVVASDGVNVNTTALTIVKSVSSDARLDSINGLGELKPTPFDRDAGFYSATVDYDTATIDLSAIPVAAISTVTLTVNGVTVDGATDSGTGTLSTDAVALKIGENTLTYTVTAQDGVTVRRYTVHVVREASANAYLELLDYGDSGTGGLPKTIIGYENEFGQEVLDGDGDPILVPIYSDDGFEPDVFSYYGTVEHHVTSTTVTAIPQDSNAAVYVDTGSGYVELTGDTITMSNLDVGDNEVKVRVVAQDGETELMYTLNIFRYGSTNNNLAGLTAANLTDPGMVPTFDKDTVAYDARTEPRFDKTTITATAEEAGASVFIKRLNSEGRLETLEHTDHEAVASDIGLEYGANVFIIEVIAQSGAEKQYRLTITREDKYTGLIALIDPDTVEFPELLVNPRGGDYILDHQAIGGDKTITLTATGADTPVGPLEDVTYELGSFTDPDGVLSVAPVLGADGKTVTFTAATGIAAGFEATLPVIIHTPNYEDAVVTLTFATVPKTPVDIAVDSNKPVDKVYDGNSVPKPGDADLTIEDGNREVTEEMDDITYIYTGDNGTVYGPDTEPPTDAGDYVLTVTTADEDYEGELEIPFTIAQKALTVAEAGHTKPYDGITDAVGVILTLSGVEPADAGDVSTDTVTAAYTDTNAGTKTIDITAATLTGSRAHNYTVTPEDGFTVTAPAGKATAGIVKATGLGVTVPDDIQIYEMLKSAKPGTFRLDSIGLTPPAGVAGARSYTADDFDDIFHILTAKPAVHDDELAYTATAGKAANLLAELTVTITTVNYEDVQVTLAFRTIGRKPLTVTTAEDDVDKTYDGDPFDPDSLGDLTIKDVEDDKTGDLSNDVTITYSGKDSEGNEYGPTDIPPTDAGDYVVTITVENEEYFGETEIPFTIAKAEPLVNWPTGLVAAYGDQLADLTPPADNGGGIPGVFTWTAAGTTPVGPAGSRTHNMTFTPDDTRNYHTAAKDITVTVKKATPVIAAAPTVAGADYGDRLGDVSLNGGSAEHSATDTTPVPGTFTWNAPDTELAMNNNGENFAVTFTPADTDNYNSVGIDITVTVQKADGLVVSLRDPILFIKAGNNLPQTYALNQPNVMLYGPAGAPANVAYSIAGGDVTDTDAIFDGPGGAEPDIAGTGLTYTPDGDQLEDDEASVKITVTSDNYATITTDIRFLVIPKDPAVIMGLLPDNAVYDGEEHSGHTGDIVVRDEAGGEISDLQEGDISFTYTGRNGTAYGGVAGTDEPPVGAGDYTVIVKVDNANYHGEKEINFTIAKATPVIAWPTGGDAVYGDMLEEVSLNGGTASHNAAAVFGGFDWENAAVTSAGPAGSRTHGVIFTPTDMDNYNTVAGTVTITVAKADPYVTWPTNLTGGYGDALSGVTLPGDGKAVHGSLDATPVPGVFTWDNGTETLTVVGSAGYPMTFTPYDTNNYNNAANSSVAVSVGKAAGLTAAPDPLEIEIKLSATAPEILDLAAVSLSESDAGIVDYALSGALTGDPIFGTNPAINDNTLTFTPSASKTAGQTATQKLRIITERYEDVTIDVIFTVIPKASLQIRDVIGEDGVYNGSPHDGYAGTPAIIAGDGSDRTAELTGDLEYRYTGRGDTTHGDPTLMPTVPGDYTVTITVENDDYIGEKVLHFTIEKGSGLTVDPDTLTVLIREAATAISRTYDVAANISLIPPAGGVTGAVAYGTDLFINDDNVLSGAPTITGGGNLTYVYAGSRTDGQTAEQRITITTGNYEDIYVTVRLAVVDKTEVTIGGLTGKDGTYSGGTHDGYEGTLSIIDEDSIDRTAEIRDSLDYVYTGTLSDGTAYTGPGKPNMPGDYTVTISVPDSNVDYTGSVSITFTVDKAAGPGAPALAGTDVTAYGGSDGSITITDYNAGHTYQISGDGTDYSDAVMGAPGRIDGLTAGTWYVRIKATDTAEAGTPADVTLGQPRGVTLLINKNGSPWTGHGKIFKLSDGTNTYTGTGADGTVIIQVSQDGTYTLYDGTDSTGETVVLDSNNGSAAITLNYYSVNFTVHDGAGLSGSKISAAYGGTSISDGATVLGGKELVITVEDTAGADIFIYAWTGDGTGGASGETLTITSLDEQVDATCSVTGISAGITVSAEGLSGLKYGDSVDGKIIFTLDDEDGKFEYAGSAPLTLLFSILDGKIIELPFGEDELGEDELGEDELGEDEPGEDELGEDEPGEDEPGEDEPGEDETGKGEPGKDEPGEDETDKGKSDEKEASEDETGKNSAGNGESVNIEPSKNKTDNIAASEYKTNIRNNNENYLLSFTNGGFSLPMSRNPHTVYTTPVSVGKDNGNVGKTPLSNVSASGGDTDTTGSQSASEDETYATGSRSASEDETDTTGSRSASEDETDTTGGRSASEDETDTTGGRSASEDETDTIGGQSASGVGTDTADSQSASDDDTNLYGNILAELMLSPELLNAVTYEFDPADFTVGNLPSGLTAGTAVRVGETVVEVPVTGTVAEIGSSFPLTIPSSVAEENVVGAQNPVPVSGTVTLAVDKAIPAAPKVTGDDKKNQINGIGGGMEYSTDGGQTWIDCDSGLPNLSGDLEILIRYGETATHEPSPPTSITFSRRESHGSGSEDEAESGGSMPAPVPTATPGAMLQEPDEAPASDAAPSATVSHSPIPVKEDSDLPDGNNPLLPDKRPSETNAPSLPSETIRKTTLYDYGSGSVTLTIVKHDGQEISAAVVDSAKLIETIIPPEELERIAGGEHAEIRIDIRHLPDAADIPEDRKAAIEDYINGNTAINGLTLEQYVDITLEYRFGDGDWISIGESGDEVELTINIPSELLIKNAQNYIIRHYNGDTKVLDDLDSAPHTITIKTRFFSTYAIAGVRQEEPAHVCPICGFCPEPFGLCVFIWLLIIVATALAVWLIIKRKTKQDRGKESQT